MAVIFVTLAVAFMMVKETGKIIGKTRWPSWQRWLAGLVAALAVWGCCLLVAVYFVPAQQFLALISIIPLLVIVYFAMWRAGQRRARA